MQSEHKVIAYGRTAELLAYHNNCVLKLFRIGIPANLAEEEFRISVSVYESGFSTPQPLEIVDYHGRKGIVYERVTGATMLKIIAKKPWTMNKQSARMAQIHADMHSKHVAGLPNQKDVLMGRIEEAPILSRDEKQIIVHYLQSLKEDRKLCHGDYHPDNIMIDEREWTIDWMTGMSGNPAGDVARTVLLLKLGTMPEETPKLLLYLTTWIRNQLLKQYISHYLQKTYISYEEIEHWMLPISAARLTEWIPEKEKQEIVNLIRQKLSAL
ncbi:MAG TPA: aminoglycoside phosphotransferase family protein [Paenibacillus sp.]|jgi:hypothetical protein